MARRGEGTSDALPLSADCDIPLEAFSRRCGVSVEVVVEMVEHGVVEPEGPNRTAWRFSALALVEARRALRLRRDLELNWPGVALSLRLLDELARLRRRHRALLRQVRP